MRLRKREPHISGLSPLNLSKAGSGITSRLPEGGISVVRRQITGRANCHASSLLVPPMWSKELAARKGICALSPATWFCLADGGSTFPLCGSSAPFVLVINLRERLPVGVLDDEAGPAVHNVEGKSPNWGALAAHLLHAGSNYAWLYFGLKR
jgi:hypothetical protein